MPNHVTILLVDLVVIIALARIFGTAARLLRQPPVIGEILAGVFVLPLLADTGVGQALLPDAVRADLTTLANIGITLFMFLVGMEFDGSALLGRGRLTTAVSVSSVVLPLGLGTLLGLYLSDEHGTGNRAGFVAFMAVALSITAFPVLARILTDRDMQRTPVGSLALAAAAVNDLVAWVLLALTVGLVGGTGGQWQLLLMIPYLVVMLGVVRPLLRSLSDSPGSKGGTLAVVVVGLLLSAAATEWMGMHLVFGAFLFGMVMPRTETRQRIHDRIADLNLVLLLPIFFVIAGLRADLSAFDSSGLAELALIIAVAIVGKFVGAYAAARACGVPARQSAMLGSLMNTRGLTELIVLNIGSELGLLTPRLYTLLVVMALVTTVMTGPLLTLFRPAEGIDGELLPPRPARRAVNSEKR